MRVMLTSIVRSSTTTSLLHRRFIICSRERMVFLFCRSNIRISHSLRVRDISSPFIKQRLLRVFTSKFTVISVVFAASSDGMLLLLCIFVIVLVVLQPLLFIKWLLSDE